MRRRGSTTVTVIANVAVILVMIVVGVGLFFSMTYRSSRPGSTRTATNNNLKQIALAASMADSVNSRLPPAFAKYGGATGRAADTALFVHLLPFVEQNPLYLAGVAEAAKGNVPPMLAMLDPTVPSNVQGHCSYAANLRVFAKCGYETPALHDVKWFEGGPDVFTNTLSIDEISRKDGTANTAMFATRYAVCNGVNQNITASPALPQGAFFGAAAYSAPAYPRVAGATPVYLLSPKPTDCDATPSYYAQSLADGPLYIAMCDGSIKRVSQSVLPASWANLLCPDDKNELGPDVFE